MTANEQRKEWYIRETKQESKRPTTIEENIREKNNVNKIEQRTRSTTGQSKISASNSSRLPKLSSKVIDENLSKSNSKITEMDRENFYYWGAT